MPSDAPAVKRIATEGYGGEVIVYDRDKEDREDIGRRLARDRGLTLIPPYDHPHVIAGQGTAARELIEEVGGWTFSSSRAAAADCSSGSALGRAAPSLQPAR